MLMLTRHTPEKIIELTQHWIDAFHWISRSNPQNCFVSNKSASTWVTSIAKPIRITISEDSKVFLKQKRVVPPPPILFEFHEVRINLIKNTWIRFEALSAPCKGITASLVCGNMSSIFDGLFYIWFVCEWINKTNRKHVLITISFHFA